MKTSYPLLNKDTIAAVATPFGNSAIAIIRLSGKNAIKIIQSIFSKNLKEVSSHSVHFGHILDKKNNVIDSVVVVIMKNPHSYTGEDSVEINCHGNPLIIKRILKRLFEKKARPAQPGEFTYRAFINKKMDLAQAEAVQELISAQNETAKIAAQNQLEGKLSKKILSFQKKLTDITAIIEASLDFPEEGLEFSSENTLMHDLKEIIKQMQDLNSTYENGEKIKAGINLCLCGSPNVGKSSLFNLLLRKERAIVTEIPGTTRDILKEELTIGPLHFHLMDTAGIRKTKGTIEQEGIKRTKKMIEKTDIILLLLDASQNLNVNDYELMQLCPKEKTLLVWNKIDLEFPTIQLKENTYPISVKETTGIDVLLSAILRKIDQKKISPNNEIILTLERHKKALDDAIDACKKTLEGLQEKKSYEFLSFDLRYALSLLSSIIGTDVSEDILSSIFSQFCIGK